ncbi:hypothetical protein [Mesorhizobium sp.]|uniref:hypothetical protein n=1 Tax=Mesorhizobium sp. TaxID=1871066 RepID=UPI001206C388|nr:hypothetical protein [Mesorhizobium sp.]TIX23878.1 MAG: hypothetical protein E5V35_20520 [Mesorhizobium sp.]
MPIVARGLPASASPDGAPFAHFTESCPVAPSAVILSDAVLILVGSIALYEGCTLPKLIENWAATHARKIGLGALAREVLERSGGP